MNPAFPATSHRPVPTCKQLLQVARLSVCVEAWKANEPPIFGETSGSVVCVVENVGWRTLAGKPVHTASSGIFQPLPQSHVFPTGRWLPSAVTKRWLCPPRQPAAHTESYVLVTAGKSEV